MVVFFSIIFQFNDNETKVGAIKLQLHFIQLQILCSIKYGNNPIISARTSNWGVILQITQIT